jgi:tRNA pseudouridine38-40 synthase
LNFAAMRAAAPALVGEHDFSALRAANCPARTTLRSVRRMEILQNGSQIDFVIEATAFLKHMVRNIVGTLVEIGHARRAPDSLPALLEGRDRKRAGPTAPAHGLVLDEVFYLPGSADPHQDDDE